MRPRLRRAAYVLLGVAAGTGLIVALLSAVGPDRSGEPARAEVSSNARPPAAEGGSSPADQRPGAAPDDRADPEERLPSHRGTAIDGGVTLDSDGRIIPDRHLHRLFEYFLTGLGRAEPSALRQRLANALHHRELPPQARGEILDIFDRYITYRRALADMKRPDRDPESLRAAFDRRYRLRREILGQELAEGLFSRREAINRYAIEARRVRQAHELSATERERRLRLLRQQLPKDVREARRRSRIAADLHRRTEALRESGASRADIQKLRRRRVGPEAAERLAELDERREAWRERVEAYRQARDRILETSGLDPKDKREAIDELIEARFDEREARRIRALDRMRSGGSGSDPGP